MKDISEYVEEFYTKNNINDKMTVSQLEQMALKYEREAKRVERVAEHLKEEALLIRDTLADNAKERLELHSKINEGWKAKVLLDLKRKGIY